jgi:hypothetical protein
MIRTGPYFMGYPLTFQSIARARHPKPLCMPYRQPFQCHKGVDQNDTESLEIKNYNKRVGQYGTGPSLEPFLKK